MTSVPLGALLLLLSIASASKLLAQQTPELKGLERTVVAELEETNTPGAAVVIVSGQRVALAKGFGVANVETGVPVTTETLFKIGGMSKFLVALVLVTLAEEGKVDLDAPVGKYVKGLSPKLSRVTARQLLSEKAGVKEDHLRMGLYDDAALGKIVRSWGDDWLIADPGRIQSGSHPGYAIAGLLIEEVVSKPFDDAMNEKLFSPLGMTRSTFRPLVAFTYPFSQGHREASGQKPTVVRPFAANSVGWPSYSLFASVSDLSRFLVAFVNGGKLDGRQVLSEPAVSTLAKGNRPSSDEVDAAGSYGLASTRYGSHAVLTGNYAWGGMRPLIRIVPDAGFGIIIISNGGSRHLTRTLDKAMEMFLGSAGSAEKIAKRPLPITKADMSAYLGTYENERVMTLFLKESRLFIRDDTPSGALGNLTRGVELPVMRVAQNRFSFTPPGASMPTFFTLIDGLDGKVEYLHVGSRALRRR
jgi:CubicO group peptidase (beta-lactamase class C family)